MSRKDDNLLVDAQSFSNDYMEHISEERRLIIEDCMIAMGYPVITLYITQRQIDRLIDFAVRRCEPSACVPYLETFNLTSTGVIDVSKYDMQVVRQIYQGSLGTTTSTDLVAHPDDKNAGCNTSFDTCDICNQLCQYRTFGDVMNSNSQTGLYNYYAYLQAQSLSREMLMTDWYLDPTDQKLYVDGYSGLITVEYIKNSTTFEEISKNAYWKRWIRDYVLAMVKITEGRIRSKYKISSGVFEIESDELINEGNTDKQELEQRLEDNAFGYWNIMRS